MTNEDKEKFRSLLTLEKEKLEKELIELNDVDFGADIDSGEEESDETEELSTNISLRDGFNARLEDIDTALEKLDAGTYGICENCGNEIQNDLLEIDPESRLCKNCKVNGQ